MPELVDLRLLRPGDARVRVADADRHDAAEEIQIALPLHVPHMLHLAPLQRQRVGKIVGDGGVNVLLFPGNNLFAVHGGGFLSGAPTTW